MKITQKFLLFGLVPVAAQAAICLQMFALLRSVEFYAEQEAKQSLISRKLAESISQSVEVAVGVGAYANYQAEGTAAFLQIASDRLEKRMNELLDLAKDDPETLADVKKMAEFGRNSKDQYLALKGADPIGTSTVMKSINDDAFKNGQTFVRRARSITKILEREDARLKQTREKSKAKRGEVKRLIWVELALCICILITFYFLFRYDFGRRFSYLLQIASELALDKPQTRTISGTDELGELSKALNDAAQTRREATSQKQMLFQMVTHDLRSPLMAACVLVDTILNDSSGVAEQRQKRLENLEKSLQRVVGLTNDLLTIEKLSAGAIELRRVKADFKETIDQSIDTVLPLAEQNQCTIVNHSPSLLVSIDEDRVLQVLVNLLANAIKFSPANAKVDVTATIDGDFMRVEVLDRGSGITGTDLQKIFSPFQQGDTSNVASGFGLGLAIAKLLVALHDGEIGAQSRPGGGTIFWFSLRI